MNSSPPAATKPGLPLANRARRFAALTYEALLLTAVTFVAGFVALPLVTPGRAATATALVVPDLPQRVALFCMLFGVLAWFCVASWSRGRRTLPMKTWRLQLTMADGSPVTRQAALLRYLACWIGPVLAILAYAFLRNVGLGAQATWLIAFNFLWAFIDRERQFLHDRVAGTRIVDSPPASSAARAPA